MILLRIEVSNDVESVSDLEQAGAGPAPVSAGAVAGFAIPPLRYFVGGQPQSRREGIALLAPEDLAGTKENSPVDLSWMEIPEGSLYRVVVIDPSNNTIATALLRHGVGAYRLPPWVWTKTDARHVSWSVEALDENGSVLTRSPWRTLFRQPAAGE